MRLIEARITNFRSSEDSGPFSLDQVTALVGKNEAGKSAILMALAALKPHPSTPATLDKERDYPRRLLTAYAERHKDGEAVAVTTRWKLEDNEIREMVALLGPKGLKSDEVIVKRCYAKEAEWEVSVDVKEAVGHWASGRGFTDIQLAELQGATDRADLAAKIEAISDLTPPQSEVLKWLRGSPSFVQSSADILKRYLPSFMYFSNYDRMDGAVRLEHLRELKENGQINNEDHNGARLFMEFFEFAGVPLDGLLEIQTYETFNAKLEAASNNISDQILEYWTQNPDLSVEVKIDGARPGDKPPLNEGTIGRARIYNALHRVGTPFSERSAGFVWFFSFLVKFAQVKMGGLPVILLLDEPGLTLHGKAQQDLLRYFDEKLAPHHQIIYSTHSPFMVAADKLPSARIVEDQVEMKGTRRLPLGTKVITDILTTDPDTLFPLQGALGYEITQSLFVGKHTLLVEGPSDILYLQALSNALNARNRVGLHPKWTLCPSGGIGNVKAFVSLFGGDKLDVCVLTAHTKQNAKNIEDLRKGQILKTGRVFTMAAFTGKSESDVEDLFEPSLFVSIVNAAYDLPATNMLTAQGLENADTSTSRLVKKAEAAFRVMPATIPIFDHFTPAAWLIRNPSALESSNVAVANTLDRAEQLFGTLDAALKV